MTKNMLIQGVVVLSAIVILLTLVIYPSCTAKELEKTELQIISIKGGIGKVQTEIKNIGQVTAEDIQITVSAKGGILGGINITKICTGCSNCGTTLNQSAIRTESTAEEGKIFGFGPITITVSSKASNADEVTKTTKGFVLGPLVIVL